jgi:hypothetical protein
MPSARSRVRSSRAAWIAVLAIALAVSPGAPLPALAQDHSTIVRVLRESRDFRARTRAALALGATGDRAMVGPLVGALHDQSAAVRAAAATALGRLGNVEALPELRTAAQDPAREVRQAAETAVAALGPLAGSAPVAPVAPTAPRGALPYPAIEVLPPQRDVDWRTVRYVVVLGTMQNRSGFAHDRLGTMFGEEVHRHLRVLRGVAALPDGPQLQHAETEISRRRLPRMRLEGSITNVHRAARGRELSVRCEVSLMLMDEPGHNLRAALNGAATGSEPASAARTAQEMHLAEQALEGAVRSAMSGAAHAITGAAGR